MKTRSTSRAREFREQLSRRALVADGAMGTMLYGRGVFINRSYDDLNLSSPELVRQIHQEYVPPSEPLRPVVDAVGSTEHERIVGGFVKVLARSCRSASVC